MDTAKETGFHFLAKFHIEIKCHRGKPIKEYQIDEYQMTWAFMIIAWGGCICYIPVNIMIPSTGCILGPFSNLYGKDFTDSLLDEISKF